MYNTLFVTDPKKPLSTETPVGSSDPTYTASDMILPYADYSQRQALMLHKFQSQKLASLRCKIQSEQIKTQRADSKIKLLNLKKISRIEYQKEQLREKQLKSLRTETEREDLYLKSLQSQDMKQKHFQKLQANRITRQNMLKESIAKQTCINNAFHYLEQIQGLIQQQKHSSHLEYPPLPAQTFKKQPTEGRINGAPFKRRYKRTDLYGGSTYLTLSSIDQLRHSMHCLEQVQNTLYAKIKLSEKARKISCQEKEQVLVETPKSLLEKYASKVNPYLICTPGAKTAMQFRFDSVTKCK